MGRPPPLPTGEAVIVKDALRAIPLSGAFWVLSQCLMQQRRAVRAMVREERDRAAGDEEPATKSRASSYQQYRKRNQGDGASGTDRREWSRARSTVSNPGNREPAPRRPPPNAVRASPERSDTRAPGHPAAGRALAASGSEQWAKAGGQLRRD